jgi:hypothetical protein
MKLVDNNKGLGRYNEKLSNRNSLVEIIKEVAKARTMRGNT